MDVSVNIVKDLIHKNNFNFSLIKNMIDEDKEQETYVDLSDQMIDDDSLKDTIKNLFNNYKKLKKLNLKNNKISQNGLYFICKSLNETNIEEIDLSNNEIISIRNINEEENIFEKIIQQLNENKSFKKLNLSSNRISERDIIKIIENMSDSIGLEELNLCFQKNINEKGIKNIIHLIYKKNPKVKIYLSDNKIEDIIENVKSQIEKLKKSQVNRNQIIS